VYFRSSVQQDRRQRSGTGRVRRRGSIILDTAWLTVGVSVTLRTSPSTAATTARVRTTIDRVAGQIIRLVASVCVSVRLSVGALLSEPFDLDFWLEGRP